MMRTEECVIAAGKERLAATKLHAFSGAPPSVVAFHGIGNTTRARIRYVLDYLALHGLSSLCFDFSGHGESTGFMDQSSVLIRTQEARAAIDYCGCPGPSSFVGTSMGGHVAALLSAEFRPQSLVLFCPAAYPEEATELRFDHSFRSVIQQSRSRLESPAFEALGTFKGNLLIVAGSDDRVVPPDVIETYLKSAGSALSKRVVWLEGCDHRIHAWLQDHEEQREMVLQSVLTRVMEV
jgi:pimeloyl-ACP methyl ester carboxylesterase